MGATVFAVKSAAAAMALSVAGLSVPGNVQGVTFSVDWQSAGDAAVSFQAWVDAAAARSQQLIQAPNNVAARFKLTCPPGSVITLGSLVTVDGSKVQIDFQYATVKFTNPDSAGFVITSSEFETGPRFGVYHQNKNVMENVSIIGPGGVGVGSTATSQGVTFMGWATAPEGAEAQKSPASLGLRDVTISHFGSGLVFDRWCYLNTCDKVSIFFCNKGITTGPNMAGGERLTFTNTNVGNCYAAGIDLDKNTAWFFTNCSIDYNVVQIILRGSTQLTLTSSWVEHGTNATTSPIQVLSGNQMAGVTASNTQFVCGQANNFGHYLTLAGLSFFDATACVFQGLNGTTSRQLCAGTTGRVRLRESQYGSNFASNPQLPGGDSKNLAYNDPTGAMYHTYVELASAANANNFTTRLVGLNMSVVSSGGYAEFRKTGGAGAGAAVWMYIPIPAGTRRSVTFSFDEVAIGATGNMQVLTRWGNVPNPSVTNNTPTNVGLPDDSMYNTTFNDPGQYTPPSTEATRYVNRPGFDASQDVPAWATHLVVKFACSSLANYSAGTVVYKIRNLKVWVS